jgi:hypothetical protein
MSPRKRASGALTPLPSSSRVQGRKPPDASFDLFNDGHIGRQDLAFAQLFDFDRDGVLEEDFRSAAREAIELSYPAGSADHKLFVRVVFFVFLLFTW